VVVGFAPKEGPLSRGEEQAQKKKKGTERKFEKKDSNGRRPRSAQTSG